MVEELEECEILWPHEMMIKCHDNTTPLDQDIISHAKPSAHEENKNKNKKEKKECSKPMEIQRGHSWSHGAYKHKFDNDNKDDEDDEDDDCDDDDDDDDDKKKVPPHVVVTRRFTDRMVYSVCTGNGRTLKGRDLRNVRDSILRMTGFLER